MPKNVRNAVPIGGASLVMFNGQSEGQQEGGLEVHQWLTTAETLGGWSRFTGYFAPRKSVPDNRGDEGVHRQESRCQVVL